MLAQRVKEKPAVGGRGGRCSVKVTLRSSTSPGLCVPGQSECSTCSLSSTCSPWLDILGRERLYPRSKAGNRNLKAVFLSFPGFSYPQNNCDFF